MNPSFSRVDTEFMLPGPSGVLEAMTTWPVRGEPQGVAIICHPHPLHQGTMRNKVVTMLAKTMQQLQLATVRFNYRGVGKSAGRYGAMVGEIEDLTAVMVWVKQALPRVPVWLLGFSFGAYISAARANQDSTVARLISVAPAVNHADFRVLTAISCPWLILQGELDEIVPCAEVAAFAATPPSPVKLVTLPEAGHFFHGQLVRLREELVLNLNT